jgi:hypothetical protein
MWKSVLCILFVLSGMVQAQTVSVGLGQTLYYWKRRLALLRRNTNHRVSQVQHTLDYSADHRACARWFDHEQIGHASCHLRIVSCVQQRRLVHHHDPYVHQPQGVPLPSSRLNPTQFAETSETTPTQIEAFFNYTHQTISFTKFIYTILSI